MFIILVVSALCVGFFSLGYKILGSKEYNTNLFLLMYAIFFSLSAFIASVIFSESLINNYSVSYGFVNGISMYIAVYLYTQVVKHIKLNISWTIIQFSLLIPIIVSIIVFNEVTSILLYAGITFIIFAVYAFGKGKDNYSKSKPAIPNIKIGVMLLLSTLFTGIANTIPKVYIEKIDRAGNFSLLFYSGITIFLLSLLNILVKKNKEIKAISTGLIKLSIYMGFIQVAGISLLIISLRTLPGTVVYPLRNVISLLVVYILSYFIFKEKINGKEGIGVVFSFAAIVLISMAL